MIDMIDRQIYKLTLSLLAPAAMMTATRTEWRSATFAPSLSITPGHPRNSDRQIDRQINRQINRQIDRQTDRQIDRQVGITLHHTCNLEILQIDRQIDEDRKIEIYKQIDRQIDILLTNDICSIERTYTIQKP